MIEVTLDHSREMPLYLQLSEAVATAVREGRLKAGDRLPSEAQMAASLNINNHTISRGYGELARRGVVTQRRGLGTRIAPGALAAMGVSRGNILRRITLVTSHHDLSGVNHAARFMIMDVLAGISAAARERSIELCLESSVPHALPTGSDAEGGILIYDSQVGKLDLNHEWLGEVMRRGIPIATVGSHHPLPGVPYVSYDRYAAAAMACRHLIECGYRSIGFIGELEPPTAGARMKFLAYADECRKGGIDILSRHVVHAPFADGKVRREALSRLLSSAPLPEAIFADTDYKAMELIQALRAKGLSVPGDVGVMGYDGIPEGREFDPQLTTVALSRQEIGARAVKLLCEWPQEGEVPDHVEVAAELWPGKSTRSSGYCESQRENVLSVAHGTACKHDGRPDGRV